MPARIRKIRHDDETRAKIQTSQIINRLTGHLLGTVDLTATQVRAAEILLNKTLPNLASVEHSGEIATPTVIRAPEVAANVDQWQKQHGPQSPVLQ